VALEYPDVEAFLVQINPRVTAEFTGHGSRVLSALEARTGKSFLFEGSEGLELDHFAITFQGTRKEVEERALPFREGDEVLVEIVEPHMYDVDDAVAKIDGYIISIAGAARHVGEKRMVRIDQVGRTAATALLLDESGEVVRPAPVSPPPRRRRQAPARPASKAPSAKAKQESGTRGDGAAAQGNGRVARANGAAEQLLVPDSADVQSRAPDGPAVPSEGAGQGLDARPGEGSEDGLQSKSRRRGRRGGRRRSAAKAPATPE
jgi:predicted RNA-binding protein with TRAM domain